MSCLVEVFRVLVEHRGQEGVFLVAVHAGQVVSGPEALAAGLGVQPGQRVRHQPVAVSGLAGPILGARTVAGRGRGRLGSCPTALGWLLAHKVVLD